MDGREDSPAGRQEKFIFCGPGEGRRKLTIKASADRCQSWPQSRMVYSGHSAYSAMAALPDGGVGVLYEKDAYRRLSFVRFDPGWVGDGSSAS
jgi:sialidase-1